MKTRIQKIESVMESANYCAFYVLTVKDRAADTYRSCDVVVISSDPIPNEMLESTGELSISNVVHGHLPQGKDTLRSIIEHDGLDEVFEFEDHVLARYNHREEIW